MNPAVRRTDYSPGIRDWVKDLRSQQVNLIPIVVFPSRDKHPAVFQDGGGKIEWRVRAFGKGRPVPSDVVTL
jgi:hypothetical protein